MKRVLFLICLLVMASVFVSCGSIAQVIPSPTPLPPAVQPIATFELQSATATPNIPALPTKIRVQVATPEISPTIPDTTPTIESGVVVTDPTLKKLIDEAKADLVTRANVALDEIIVKNTQSVEWRDASLGCPIPGMMYAQMITPGYLIVLQTAGKEWKYHASMNRVVWCDK